jgi:gamma-glutamyl:cysteine ligase YbdK (ATP-grasp superfamily)
VIGIAFNLIIIRAAQASGGDNYNASTEVGTRSRSQYPLQFVSTGAQSTVIGQHVNVTVTREEDRMSDPPDKFRDF